MGKSKSFYGFSWVWRSFVSHVCVIRLVEEMLQNCLRTGSPEALQAPISSRSGLHASWTLRIAKNAQICPNSQDVQNCPKYPDLLRRVQNCPALPRIPRVAQISILIYLLGNSEGKIFGGHLLARFQWWSFPGCLLPRLDLVVGQYERFC